MSRTPVEIQVLKFAELHGSTGVDGKRINKIFGNETHSNFVDKFLDRKDKKGTWMWVLNAEGRFKLIEWENLQTSRRQFWVSIVIAVVAMLILVGGIVFSLRTSNNWQREQIIEFKISNEFLQKISEK